MTLTQPATLDWPASHPPSLGFLQTLSTEPMAYPPPPLVLLLPPLVLYPSLGSVCGRTMGTAADWASNPDEADSSCIDWAAGFLLLHSKKAVHLDWLSAVGHLFCYRSKSPKAKKRKRKNKSNSDLGDLCLCICLYVCLCVYVPGHVRECEQKQKLKQSPGSN